jgi:hypothetical protein
LLFRGIWDILDGMELIIGAALPQKNKPKSFEVEIEVMHGDGDAYKKLITGPFYENQDEPALQELLAVVEKISQVSLEGSETYENVEGFAAWFNSSGRISEKNYSKWYRNSPFSYQEFKVRADVADAFYEKNGGFRLHWPLDVTNEDTVAAYDNHKVFYYDENLVQHQVTVRM